MALYPSLEDLKIDKLMKTQTQNETVPSAPRLSELLQDGQCAKYPSLGEYMGLELTQDVIAANMPEYLTSADNMQLAQTQIYPVAPVNSGILAPLSGHSLGLQKAFVTNGIREVTLCKDSDGKLGLRVQSINNGVFINLIRKNSPAAMAGLRFGDQILEINGKSVAGFSMDAVHEVIKKANGNGISFVIRDRPFERTVTLHKDNTGHMGFSFKDGRVTSLVIDSSAAKNGLLTDHNLLEVNGQNVVGLKDKEITKIISEGGDVITITVVPSFIYQHMTKSYNVIQLVSDDCYSSLRPTATVPVSKLLDSVNDNYFQQTLRIRHNKTIIVEIIKVVVEEQDRKLSLTNLMNLLTFVLNFQSKRFQPRELRKFLSYTEMETPWTSQDVNQNINNELLKHFRGERSGFIQVGPKKYFLPGKFAKEGDKYYRFQPRPSDTWVVSYPRSGTTWTQEMVWLLGNNLDFARSAKLPLVERFPFLEFDSCVHEDVLEEFLREAEDEETRASIQRACGSVLEELESTTESRFIKSHLPFSLLHPDLLSCGAKVIYVARNPKDVAASYYHFHQFIKTLDYVGDFETFWNYFEQNLELWAPYWDHLNEAWNKRNEPNLLFLFYEDLKQDLRGSIKKVAKFLKREYAENDIESLISHLDFKNFQKNRSVNMEVLRDLGMLSNYSQGCIRQGKTGGWKELFSPRLNKQANEWIKKNLEKTGITFPDNSKFLIEL